MHSLTFGTSQTITIILNNLQLVYVPTLLKVKFFKLFMIVEDVVQRV